MPAALTFSDIAHFEALVSAFGTHPEPKTAAYFAHRKAAWINEDIASGALVEFQSHGLADYVEIVSVDAIGPRLRFNLLSGSSDTRRLMEYDSWSLRVGPRR